MKDADFFAQMRIGIPPIARPAAPAAHRCECDPTSNPACDDCQAVDHALRQHATTEDYIE
ncbi:hypothetical protein [Stenotrophomonas bentonitica]|uniref:Uncharacterized protein n=1 Tax=Stenotrophomonas bentonitica TaxID=1450134 RepID=A0ABU9JSG0_9GAMM